MAKKHGLTPVQLALGFVRDRPFMTSSIIGATSVEQLKEDIDAFLTTERPLPLEVMADIENIFKRYKDPTILWGLHHRSTSIHIILSHTPPPLPFFFPLSFSLDHERTPHLLHGGCLIVYKATSHHPKKALSKVLWEILLSIVIICIYNSVYMYWLQIVECSHLIIIFKPAFFCIYGLIDMIWKLCSWFSSSNV